MYLLYFGDIPNLVSCAFLTIPIFPPFNSQNFLFTCSYSNMAVYSDYCFHSLTSISEREKRIYSEKVGFKKYVHGMSDV